MSKEQSPRPLPETGFDFDENEELFNRVSDKRFNQIVFDEKTVIHQMEVSSNSYGEFLFATVSRDGKQGREVISFYGGGYHEYRDRWLTNTWFWYKSNTYSDLMNKQLTREEAKQALEERRQEIEAYAHNHSQSKQGVLFEIIADLIDDDGAIADLEDFPDWFDE